MIKSQKGITLLSLAVTIVILMILTSTSVYNVNIYLESKKRENINKDLQKITEKVEHYYANNKELPILNKYTKLDTIKDVISVNDNENYYVVDLQKIGGLKELALTYGVNGYKEVNKREETEEISDITDVFIVNEKSHIIYYPEGVNFNDSIMIYRLTQLITETQEYNIETIKESGEYVSSNILLKDSNGNSVLIPEGFKIASDSGVNVTEGIVIEDDDITEDGNGENRGNQYVWIPVGENIRKSDGSKVEIELGRYTFGEEDGEPILMQSAQQYLKQVPIDIYYRERYEARQGLYTNAGDSTNTTVLNLKEFIKSVEENGGYYIARYEASYGTDEKANSKISKAIFDNTAPTSEGALWNFVSQLDAANASRSIYENTKINTDLVNSYAWDTAIVYIQKFSKNAQYSKQNSLTTTLANTGKAGDEVCKINDMSSNTFEFTTEHSTYLNENILYPATYRGGAYNSQNTIYSSSRNYYTVNEGANNISFRTILYTKE